MPASYEPSARHTRGAAHSISLALNLRALGAKVSSEPIVPDATNRTNGTFLKLLYLDFDFSYPQAMTPEFLKTRSPEQLETIIARHRDAGKMDAKACVDAMAELSTRIVKGFNLKLAIEHLIAAAKNEMPTDFKQIAIASGVFDPETQKWGQWVTSVLNPERMCIYCRSHDLPQLTAMLGNEGGKTSDSVTIGFLKGLDAAGIEYSGEPRAIYEEHRKVCIEWAKSL